MKIARFSYLLPLLVGSSHAADDASSNNGVYHPVQMDYQDLFGSSSEYADNDELWLDTLQDVGMISITDMPTAFRNAKQDMQALFPSCLASLRDRSKSSNSHVFEDGTKRTTVATHTMAEGEMSPLKLAEEHPACAGWEAASEMFREEVDRVTRAFARRLSDACDSGSDGEPLLQSHDENDAGFATISDIVEHGEHLEHFHNYQKDAKRDVSSTATIDWHTDQGLFLVFAPGVLVDYQSGTMTLVVDGFYIELSDGSRPMVQFDGNDDLVLLLGDGIRQVKADKCGSKSLRPLPHALSMPKPTSPAARRVWYGRMVLPPASAIHPQHEEEGLTFGSLRERMIEHQSSDPSVMALGCSGSSSNVARQLEEASCEDGTLLCNVEEENITATLCQEQGLDLLCVNPRGQKWDNTHGDWFPACVDAETAPEATDYAKLPDFPRSSDNCTDAAYAEYVQDNAAQYENMMNLTNGGVLYWTVQDGDVINGMLSYNGLFGFLALGFAGPPGSRNEMVSAKVILATPSSVYNASHGFDFDYDPMVAEYGIGSEFAFRHWQTPLSAVSRQAAIVSDSTSYAVDDGDCFTSMTFTTAGIFDRSFNVSGMDAMVWAANGEDMFAGYHGDSRGVVYVEWDQGVATLKVEEEEEEQEAEEEDEHDHEDHEDHEGHEDHAGKGDDMGDGSAAASAIASFLVVAISALVAAM
ncbi:MAG: hypothetical protein SGARI_000314 [Bacillariaceae sp.]